MSKPMNRFTRLANAKQPKPEPVTQPASQPELGNQLPSLVTQLPSLVTQPASTDDWNDEIPLVTQLPSQPVTQPQERYYPSRVQRRQKSIRLPANKLEKYEEWQHENRKHFTDFQSLVEYALDWVTSQPVTQLPSYPVTHIN